MIRIKQISFFCQQGPRNNQEDCIAPATPAAQHRVFVLCDGMGGHSHGEVASQVTSTTAEEYLRKLQLDEYDRGDLQTAADLAVDAMSQSSTFSDLRSMGTTAVIAVINKMRIIIGHAGDSRAYLFGADGRLKFRSRDHSLVAEAIENQVLTEEQALTSNYRNVITRALSGDGKHVELEFDELVVCDNDILLLCTDGVTGALTDTELQNLFSAYEFEEACVRTASKCEAMSNDNNTAIIIQLGQDEEYLQNSITGTSTYADLSSGDGVNSNECEPVQSENASIACPRCGNVISGAARFCSLCGTNLSNGRPRIEDLATDAGRTIRNGLDKALGMAEKGIQTLRRRISDRETNENNQ